MTVWLQLFESCTGCRIQYKLRLLVHKSFLKHAGIRLGPSDIGCQYSGSIYTRRLILWQSRAADTSTNWRHRQSLFCCCTASMEQATDGAETAAAAAIDGLVSSRSENLILICVWFCLRAPWYGLTLWKLLLVRLINVLTYILFEFCLRVPKCHVIRRRWTSGRRVERKTFQRPSPPMWVASARALSFEVSAETAASLPSLLWISKPRRLICNTVCCVSSSALHLPLWSHIKCLNAEQRVSECRSAEMNAHFSVLLCVSVLLSGIVLSTDWNTS